MRVLASGLMMLLALNISRSCLGQTQSGQPLVVIVTTSAVQAFDEGVEGIRERLGSEARVVTIDLAGKPEDLSSRLGSKGVRLLIAVGNNALAAAQRYGTAPVIATMLLKADLSLSRPPWSAVVLDLPLTETLSGLARVFPGKTRAGMIHNPAVDPVPETVLAAQAKAAGMKLKVAESPRAEGLLKALLSLRDLVDFVWCPPDATLFNGTTVQPLIRASLNNGLPVAGFSASFVQSGAAAGVYPDYREVGVQTGEVAHRFLNGASSAAIEAPHKVRVAANLRVARLLGIHLAGAGAGQAGVVVIE